MDQSGDSGLLKTLKRNRSAIVMLGIVAGGHFGWRWLQNQPGVRHPDAPKEEVVKEDWPIVRVSAAHRS